MRLYAHVMPVFSIDASAVSGGVLELIYVNKYFNNIKQCK